jgi:RNA polymerase sigma-70 factor (ECF subfamily)
MSTASPTDDSLETCRLLAAAGQGDNQALAALLDRHRPWLTAFAAARLDPRLRARVDPADVVQETQAEVCARLGDYLSRRPVSFRTWLLKTAYDRLGKLKRAHLLAQRRSVLQETPLTDDSSLLLAEQLAAPHSSPWEGVARREIARRVRQALARLAEIDREVLLLRYVEGLDNQEIGFLLALEPGAVSKRHGRALLRLHAELVADGLGESQR